MGLELWPECEEIAAPTTTAVTIPENLTTGQIHSSARQKYGVTLSAGRGETYDKLVRIGHMGPVAEPIYAVVAVTALGETNDPSAQKALQELLEDDFVDEIVKISVKEALHFKNI